MIPVTASLSPPNNSKQAILDLLTRQTSEPKTGYISAEDMKEAVELIYTDIQTLISVANEGPEGPQGPQGAKGDPGVGIIVKGVITTNSGWPGLPRYGSSP